MDIEEFIAAEAEYFRPMALRGLSATTTQREAWRAETVRERHERVSLEVFNLTGGKVAYGPFKGMTLRDKRWWGDLDLGSQCLGLYEKEIIDLFAQMTPHQYGVFLDIGAADGYYTTGALYSGLFDKAIAFEQSASGRDAIVDGWKLNGSPGELLVRGEASEQSILDLPQDAFNNALVLVDIEGAEFELLTDTVLAAMSTATIIIEIHNWVAEFDQSYASLIRRAAALFDIERIASVARDTSHFPELRSFTDDNRLLLCSERRPCLMRFLQLKPKG